MKVIDLSVKIHNDMDIYPGDPGVKIEQVHFLKTHGWNLRKINMGTHTGTHVDAFSHMDNENAFSIDEIPIEKFMGEAMLVSPDDDFPSDLNLLFSKKIDINYLEKILKSRPNFIGGDISVELERELLKNGIITYTDLINLDKLPRNKKFFFIGLPLKIEGGDGSPVRAVAILDK